MIPSATTPYEELLRTEARPHRNDKLACKCCGSNDLWRVGERTGLLAAIMRYRGRKPMQCRACRWICYPPVRRAAI